MSAFKAVLLGEGRVGKTSIGSRWAYDRFDANCSPTIQAGFFLKDVETTVGKMQLRLWDTAGQERYHAVAPIYYKDADAAILVYDLTDQRTFDMLTQWHSELIANRALAANEAEGVPPFIIIIVANKLDVRGARCVSAADGQHFASALGCHHFEVSAKTGEGLDMLFRYLTETLAKGGQRRAAVGGQPLSREIGTRNNNTRKKGKRGLVVSSDSKTGNVNDNDDGGCC